MEIKHTKNEQAKFNRDYAKAMELLRRLELAEERFNARIEQNLARRGTWLQCYRNKEAEVLAAIERKRRQDELNADRNRAQDKIKP
jgi:hypothetical protein